MRTSTAYSPARKSRFVTFARTHLVKAISLQKIKAPPGKMKEMPPLSPGRNCRPGKSEFLQFHDLKANMCKRISVLCGRHAAVSTRSAARRASSAESARAGFAMSFPRSAVLNSALDPAASATSNMHALQVRCFSHEKH